MSNDDIDLNILKSQAFERRYETAFRIWQRLDKEAKLNAFTDKYIVLAVCSHAGTHLKSIASVGIRGSMNFAGEFQELLVESTERMRRNKLELPQEWMEGLKAWAESLLDQYLFSLASAALDLADAAQPQRFPAVRQELIAVRAKLDAFLGNVDKAESTVVDFVLRPYLLPSRGLRPVLYQRFMPTLLSAGRIREYRTLLWRGISELYSDDTQRFWFARQVKTTYKSYSAAVLFSEAPPSTRIALFVQLLWMAATRIPVLRNFGVVKALRVMALGFVYHLNYRRPNRIQLGRHGKTQGTDGAILVTRAMGGLGDLLTMTPGLRALRKQYPQAKIHFAIPKAFFPLLEGNDDFVCIDIEDASLQTSNYAKWYDLTDCPAARIESMEFPNIHSNRIEIFASAMGIKKKELARHGYTPRYEISAAERSEAEEYIRKINPGKKKIIGIQPYSAETYRNWPQIKELAFKLARDSLVLVFNNKEFDGYESDNIVKVIRPLRSAFAIAAHCHLIISPDSSFAHLAAALSVPAIGVFGPTSGKVITRYYLNSKTIVPDKKDFPCSPCYRNENQLCNLAGNRNSVCMANINPNEVLTAIAEIINTG